ncbi:MAG: bifunctional [glutamate--ammonia ligase]-adenylyl-L-tyrosine phosphorylase/[glutamate--ammonia-ligase] adenylyltransferase, partial [Endozoicomonas sp. (ex Botrylloides leachii)]|nr:bifunctional [glutamate--ammonia ligase]-adenylyl-L-tyrosine phosphorylase/[glutamate--ammonia-ligase] adenylyltransferase [Endozoicomonas sp. (ex Botrylloides leachii)]
VMSFSAMEQYYQDQGRDWERYAMIKAQIVAGDKPQGNMLLVKLKPFVYRRYIDFSVITSLRDMKKLIEREVKRKGMENNIKLGPGGIREIEFITQSFQLIHGGKDWHLQKRALLDVLPTLSAQGYLPDQIVDTLRQAYIFLRNLEHALQSFQDKQTQNLPEDTDVRERLGFSMGFSSWKQLISALDQHRNSVTYHFSKTISNHNSIQKEPSQSDHWRMLWLNKLTQVEALELLAMKGFNSPDQSLRLLRALRDGKALCRVRRQSRERVDKFMPFLFEVIALSSQPDIAIRRLLPLVESVLRRTAYLVLLMENPAALNHLCKLCIASPWVADQIATMPSLLDEFLNLGSLYKPPKKKALADELRQQLAHIPEDDLELQMEALRYFKISHVLRVAAAHVVNTLALMKESDYLTWIAEVVLNQVINIAWRNITARYGRPVDNDGIPCDPGFIVVGYGKLGGIELGPASDLDLVFIHKGSPHKETDGIRAIDSTTFYTRLGQHIIHILTTQTLSGALYDVDMRLRPSGSSGLLVSSFSAYKKYQQQNAWTWEHQALVRARVVAGDAGLADDFEQLRQQILSQERDPEQLRQEVLDMRMKMRKHLGNKYQKGMIDIKYGAGGILDIEFLMQYAVLKYGAIYPSIVQWTDNIRISEQLEAEGLLSSSDAQKLRSAYKKLRLIIHKQALQNQQALASVNDGEAHIRCVKSLWEQWMSADTLP